MTVTKEIKIIDKKIEQNKPQQDLDGQTAKILALSSGNKFLTSEDVLPEKRLL